MKICGIDEAGRGAMAGELVVAACILSEKFDENLSDSKKLSPKKRDELFKKITQNSKFLILYFSNEEIDNFGLSWCLQKALVTIKSHFKACEFIFDGNCNYGVSDIKTIIKADNLIKEVSAASILAKVSRDKMLNLYGKIYPEYGYEKHKGYGTKSHFEAIFKFGLSKISRKSFKVQKSLF